MKIEPRTDSCCSGRRWGGPVAELIADALRAGNGLLHESLRGLDEARLPPRPRASAS